MLAAYGVDVLDPTVSLRRIGVLLERLPPHARRGGQEWSVESELLASVIDSVAMLTWVVARLAGDKNVQKPPPVPRPREHTRMPAPAGNGNSSPGPVKHARWSDAIESLMGMPGVRVH